MQKIRNERAHERELGESTKRIAALSQQGLHNKFLQSQADGLIQNERVLIEQIASTEEALLEKCGALEEKDKALGALLTLPIYVF